MFGVRYFFRKNGQFIFFSLLAFILSIRFIKYYLNNDEGIFQLNKNDRFKVYIHGYQELDTESKDAFQKSNQIIIKVIKKFLALFKNTIKKFLRKIKE